MGKDLFQSIDSLPVPVQAVIAKYRDLYEQGADGYKLLGDFEDELKPLGYTFSWYLDAEPHSLRSITKEGIAARIDEEIKNHAADDQYQDDDAQNDIFEDIRDFHGWDWEQDEDALDYFLKATPAEILQYAKEKLEKL